MDARWSGVLVATGVALGSVAGGSAAAAPFAIEGEPHATEAEAAVQLSKWPDAAAAPGSARVVRRYTQGTGWRYLVLVEGITDEAALTKAERSFPGTIARVVDVATGRAVTEAAREPVRIVPEPEAQPRQRWWSREAKPKKPAKDKAGEAAKANADAVLMRAVQAHGGNEATAAVRAAEAIRFRYTRVIVTPEKRIEAEHVWMRSGADLRLDVKQAQGIGASSTTVVRGTQEAWVATNGQVTVRPIDRSNEVVERFGPAQILAFPLGLAADIETAGAWRGLHVVDGAQTGVVHLRPKVATAGLTAAGIFEETALVAYVELLTNGTAVRIEFDDYTKVADGVIIPKTTRVIRNGDLKEELEVVELDLNPRIPSSAFDRPAAP